MCPAIEEVGASRCTVDIVEADWKKADILYYCPYCGEEIDFEEELFIMPETAPVNGTVAIFQEGMSIPAQKAPVSSQPVQPMFGNQPVNDSQPVQPMHDSRTLQPMFGGQPAQTASSPAYGQSIPARDASPAQPEKSNPSGQAAAEQGIQDLCRTEWDLYNAISVNTKDIPDLQGEYLVLGDQRLRREDIINYWVDGTKIYFEDKIEQQLMVNFHSLGKDIIKAVGSWASIVASPVMVFPAYGSMNKNKLSRFCKQMLRIAPLLGDEEFRRRGRVAAEMTMIHPTGEIEVKYSSFFDMMNMARLFEKGEYPVHLLSHKSVLTNRKLYRHDAVYELKDIVFDVVKKHPVVFAMVNGERKYLFRVSKIAKNQEEYNAIEKAVNYYKSGRMESFIYDSYGKHGVMKSIYAV